MAKCEYEMVKTFCNEEYARVRVKYFHLYFGSRLSSINCKFGQLTAATFKLQCVKSFS